MPIANTGLVIVLTVIILGLSIFAYTGRPAHDRPFDWEIDG